MTSANPPSREHPELPSWQEVVTKMRFPALAAWRQDPQEFAVIRSLTESEVAMLSQWEKPLGTAEQRLNLLKITHRNFEELQEFVEAPGADRINHRLELDRLILNYLSSAYGLHEQIRGHIKRETPQQFDAFQQFISDLEEKSFAFAFFRDFRNYAQHCELPVGKLTVTQTVSKTTVKIRHLVTDLVADYSGWKKSQLHTRTGEINLLELLKEYDDVLLGEYADWLAFYFTRQLLPLHRFAAELAAEVKRIKPAYTLVICTSVQGDGVTKVNFTCQYLPENVLGFLNIKLTPVQSDGAKSPNAS